MLKILLVLLALGCGLFYFYQKDGVEQSPAPTRPFAVDDSSFAELKKVLPPIIFEKDIQPFLEKNRQGGLTAEQLDALMEKLGTIAEALGGKTASAVQELVQKTPGFFPKKGMLERATDSAGSLAEEAADGHLPALKDMAVGAFQGLISGISRVLGVVANILSD